MTVRPIAVIATIIGAALAAAGCSENLNGGAACPVFCPDQKLPILDTTFRIDHLYPIYDTTIASFPQLGDEGVLLLANIPHRADVRGIMRFDSLVNYYNHTVDDTTVKSYPTVAHNAYLFFAVNKSGFASTRGSDQVQFFAYDVDTIADTTISVLSSMFNTAHFLGASRGFLASGLSDTTHGNTLDTVIIHLDTAKVLAKVFGDRKLRIGIVALLPNSPTDGVRMQINFQVSPPKVQYIGSLDSLKDTTYALVTSNLRSVTPVTDTSLLARLQHYPLIVQGALQDSLDALNIGGIPSRRVFLHFALPPRIIDTANVIHATLMLHPRPQPLQLPGDTLVLYPWLVVSSNKVMTAAQATNFIVSNTLFSLDSVKSVPSAAAVVSFEIVNAVRNWQNVSDTLNTRSLVLRIQSEGGTPLEASFWSSFAPDTSLRPHIRIQYVKRSAFGVP